MLVNYRRPRYTDTPEEHLADETTPDDHPKRNAFQRSASYTGPPANNFHRRDSAASQDVPEVALMYNKHVVPDWLFRRGGRLAKKEIEKLKNWQVAERKEDEAIAKRKAFRAPAPPDDFPSSFSPGNHSDFSNDNHLDISPVKPFPSHIAAETGDLAHPRAMSATPHLHHTLSTPILSHHGARPAFQHSPSVGTPPIHSINGQHCPLFGGTGSTAVNTKLKDHVFATILKRMRKEAKGMPGLPRRHKRRGTGTLSEHDDAEVSTDQEDHLSPLPSDRKPFQGHDPRMRGRLGRNFGGSMEMTPLTPPPDAEDEEGKPIKRVNSELVMSELNRLAITKADQKPSSKSVPQPKRVAREESEDREMFAMDDGDLNGQQLHEEPLSHGELAALPHMCWHD